MTISRAIYRCRPYRKLNHAAILWLHNFAATVLLTRMGMATSVAPRRRGRPPGGIRAGERLRDYPTVTIRVPPRTRRMLRALCARKRLPAWLVMRQLVLCFVRSEEHTSELQSLAY